MNTNSSNNSRTVTTACPSDRIVIGLMSKDGTNAYYRIRRDTRLYKPLTDYCGRYSVTYSRTRFLIDGYTFNHQKTPLELGLKNGDLIDVMSE